MPKQRAERRAKAQRPSRHARSFPTRHAEAAREAQGEGAAPAHRSSNLMRTRFFRESDADGNDCQLNAKFYKRIREGFRG